jgi:predicted enzyme involved in methoxymalonyl-ACP biosynthesis
MPYMNLLFSIHDEQPFHYVMVSILMTLECFEKFSKDTSYNDYNKLVIHDFTTSLLCDTEDSSHPISDNIKEVPLEVHNQQSFVTEDGDQNNYVDEASHPIHDNNTEVQSEVQDQTSICDELDVLIDEMYLVAQQVAADGNQGIGQ